jgi:hypothetical protein
VQVAKITSDKSKTFVVDNISFRIGILIKAEQPALTVHVP